MSLEFSSVEIRTSPHIKSPVTTDEIMRNVVVALLPVAAFAVLLFGLSALALILVCTGTCVLTEHVLCVLTKRPTTIKDYSAIITGLLLALTLPPGFPLWMGAMGGIVSIALGKALFGGLGHNIFNPALVGRAFLQACFTVAITTWTPPFWPKVFSLERFTTFIPSTLAFPFARPAPVSEFFASVDGWAGATPLGLMKFEHQGTSVLKLFGGMTGGSVGETSALIILLCGAYLIYKRMMNWRIPAAMLASVFVVSLGFYISDSAKYPGPFFMLFSGGLMLGAMFMATDMVTAPTTPLGAWVYGGSMGFFTVIIRLLGGLPEGVMYAILLGNALTPIIDTLTQLRIYGGTRKRKKAAAAAATEATKKA